MQQYRALDIVRFLAALLVAVGHFNIDFRLGLSALTPIVSRFGLFVDFFFILSGFVIALNYGERVSTGRAFGSFIWRRFARLWPLHLVVFVFFGALGFAGNRVGYVFTYPEVFNPSAAPWNLALLHAWGPVWHPSYNVASWSISAEMFVYLLFPFFVLLAGRFSLAACLGLIAAFTLAMILARHALGLGPWFKATYDLGALRAVPSFFLGVLIQRGIASGAWRMEMSWPVVGLFAVAVLAGLHFNAPAELVILLMGVFVWAAALAEMQSGPGLAARPFAPVLGDMSYGLYMVHMPLMTCMLFVIRRLTGFEGIWPWVFAGATLLLSLAVAFVAFRLIERPARDWLNRHDPFKPRRKPQAVAAE